MSERSKKKLGARAVAGTPQNENERTTGTDASTVVPRRSARLAAKQTTPAVGPVSGGWRKRRPNALDDNNNALQPCNLPTRSAMKASTSKSSSSKKDGVNFSPSVKNEASQDDVDSSCLVEDSTLQIRKSLIAVNGIVWSSEADFCIVCEKKVGAEQGVILQACRHLICASCLRSTIKLQKVSCRMSCPGRLVCPCLPEERSCTGLLVDAEVKGFLTPRDFQKYLDRSMHVVKKEVETGRKRKQAVDQNKKKEPNGWDHLEAIISESSKSSRVSSSQSIGSILRVKDLIQNVLPFTCSYCSYPVAPKQGVILHECLHQFCKRCLIAIIENTEEATVMCPYAGENICVCFLQPREIKELVPPNLYERYLRRSEQYPRLSRGPTFLNF